MATEKSTSFSGKIVKRVFNNKKDFQDFLESYNQARYSTAGSISEPSPLAIRIATEYARGIAGARLAKENGLTQAQVQTMVCNVSLFKMYDEEGGSNRTSHLSSWSELKSNALKNRQ